MRIDAHQHFWLLEKRGGAWPTAALPALHRDVVPAELAPLLAAHGVSATVLVQSLPSIDDTLYLLGLAGEHAFIRGVVGWVDLKHAEAPHQIAKLAANRKLKGLRPMLQEQDDDRWIDDLALGPAVEAMLRHDLGFDALVTPRHLPALLAFARRYPALQIVIDHAAKPAIMSAELATWRDGMTALALLPNVHCKLSGLVTEAGPDWQVANLQPYVDVLLAQFGPHRLIWGSDWPVLNLAADYGRWIATCETLLATLDSAELQAVFGLNAQRFYRLA
jgi:L-fuconolactonase